MLPGPPRSPWEGLFPTVWTSSPSTDTNTDSLRLADLLEDGAVRPESDDLVVDTSPCGLVGVETVVCNRRAREADPSRGSELVLSEFRLTDGHPTDAMPAQAKAAKRFDGRKRATTGVPSDGTPDYESEGGTMNESG